MKTCIRISLNWQLMIWLQLAKNAAAAQRGAGGATVDASLVGSDVSTAQAGYSLDSCHGPNDRVLFNSWCMPRQVETVVPDVQSALCPDAFQLCIEFELEQQRPVSGSL
ncbi:hypothetical protein CDV31_014393 [Fusarium ambrosium]|uniref:Secreted protein n=1 Tax=Fusarium ambrosium TaxID=131363 RepID=A0A428SWV1_9HYPO|nr:hypothetical protein CDV31_014393 [Fusarium ambrosium]